AIMSIGAANLVTRNIWRAYINPDLGGAAEARIAKIVSLGVKVGALACVLWLPTQFAIDLQLLGGIWMLQIFPAVICGLFTRWLRPSALLAGWIAGMIAGSGLAWINGLKPVYTIAFDTGVHRSIYIGLIALAINFFIAIVLTPVAVTLRKKMSADRTLEIDYEDAAV
ncbi:MAG: hypothetical protein ACREPP_07525, partial [Rhodanobacteraceae bacterium]